MSSLLKFPFVCLCVRWCSCCWAVTWWWLYWRATGETTHPCTSLLATVTRTSSGCCFFKLFFFFYPLLSLYVSFTFSVDLQACVVFFVCECECTAGVPVGIDWSSCSCLAYVCKGRKVWRQGSVDWAHGWLTEFCACVCVWLFSSALCGMYAYAECWHGVGVKIDRLSLASQLLSRHTTPLLSICENSFPHSRTCLPSPPFSTVLNAGCSAGVNGPIYHGWNSTPWGCAWR